MTPRDRIRWFDGVGWIRIPWWHSCQHAWECIEGPRCILVEVE